jgi:hypothetical protein
LSRRDEPRSLAHEVQCNSNKKLGTHDPVVAQHVSLFAQTLLVPKGGMPEALA